MNSRYKSILAFAILVFLVQMVSAQELTELTEAEVCEVMNRAVALHKEKKYKEALEAFLVVGKNTEKQRTEAERQTYVISQTMACQCYELTKCYEKGYQLAKKLLNGNIKDTERKDIAHLYVLNGYLYACQYIEAIDDNDLVKGRNLLEEISSYVDERTENYVKPKIPYIWYKQGILADMEQQYGKAMACLKEAKDGYLKLGNFKNATTVVCEIADIKSKLYDITGALATYEEAQSFAQTCGDNNQLMSIFIEKRHLNDMVSRLEASNRYAQKIDSLNETDDSPRAQYLYNTYKGDEAKSLGDTALALLWYKKNENYIIQKKGMMTSERHQYYVKLRDLCVAQKHYDEALCYARKSVNEQQSLSKPSSSKYYLPYMSIAVIYSHKGDKENCEAALDTLFMAEKYITEPRELQQLYITRASCYARFGEYEKALADYKYLDSLLSTKYGKDDGDRIRLLPLMGGMEHRLGHYEETERLYSLYAEEIKNLYSEDSDEYVDALNFLANAEAFAGHIDEGCSHYGEAVDMMKIRARKQLPYLTVAERDGYWQRISSMLINMSPFAIKAGKTQTGFTRTCYDALIMSKAFLLESDRSVYHIIKRNGTSKDMDDFAAMQALSLKMESWEKDRQHYADSITATASFIEKINRNFAKRCRGYGDMTAFMDVDYNDVKSALGENDILIDFTDYTSQSEGRKYAAFIINKQQDYPQLKYLFNERSIDSLGMTRPDYFYEEPFVSEIRKMLWQPLVEESVREGMTIYYVPSQLLFQVSLESIPLDDGSLLGDHYHFVRLSSARELLRYRSQLDIAKRSSAVLYGGLQYDVEPSLMAEEAKKYEVSPLLAMRGIDIMRGDTIFSALPETQKEVEAINEILMNKELNVQMLTGMAGTEESFLSMNGKAPKILQLATHGFYYTPDAARDINYLKGYSDAMQLSGLVMAGGDAAWRGRELPKGVLGGILTANDIASLDLNGLELVVLSACQTGQGKATAEGLYGLQRAFKKAGAKTLVMTLWSMSDAVCREFMVCFYEQLAANGWKKREAFEKAKSIIRQKYPEAFYWAGFVMLD